MIYRGRDSTQTQVPFLAKIFIHTRSIDLLLQTMRIQRHHVCTILLNVHDNATFFDQARNCNAG